MGSAMENSVATVMLFFFFMFECKASPEVFAYLIAKR